MIIALTLPGMVNMSAMKVSIDQGIRAGIKFSFGGTTTMVIQAYLAITFTKFFSANPYVILNLKRAALAIFFLLSIIFLYLAKKPEKSKKTSEKYQKRENTPLFFGIFIMAMNMLNIPFLFATSTLLDAKGWISVEAPNKWLFLLGIALGCWSLLVAYAKFADIITVRAKFIVRHLNYLLSGLFMLLALIQVVVLLNDI